MGEALLKDELAAIAQPEWHKECLDCDASILVHREGGSHCTVCDGTWPCQDAGRETAVHLLASRLRDERRQHALDLAVLEGLRVRIADLEHASEVK